jgi:hypothetical protein
MRRLCREGQCPSLSNIELSLHRAFSAGFRTRGGPCQPRIALRSWLVTLADCASQCDECGSPDSLRVHAASVKYSAVGVTTENRV